MVSVAGENVAKELRLIFDNLLKNWEQCSIQFKAAYKANVISNHIILQPDSILGIPNLYQE